MNDADWRALAAALEGFGLRLTLTDGDPQRAGQRPPAGTSIALSDGRWLTLAGEARGGGRVAADAESRLRLLTEHSIDLIIAVDLDLAIRYASPASRTLLGCTPEALRGHTLAELVVPEERAAFIARHFTRSAQHGVGPDLFRALRRDGLTRWVEARVAELPPGNGLGDYLVTLRDAEQRRRAEEALGRANAELSMQASTDVLTGLPNRRLFDATLQREWYRALRDGTPLGLLMIDIDHFKSINDLFGHQVGDLFLARVGGIIRDHVRRAGDQPARFGGEEFAVVLPGTSVTGAIEIGEQIRRAVIDDDFSAAIAGGHRVSISVGAASLVPMAGGGAASLLHSADAALYQAKRGGRNRVEALE